MLLGLGTFVSTFAGGLFALRHHDRLHLILGFTAGVLLGVVAFDVLPEIADLSAATGTAFVTPMIALVVGFLAFHVIEKAVVIHNAHEGEYGAHAHRVPDRGRGVGARPGRPQPRRRRRDRAGVPGGQHGRAWPSRSR